MKKKTIVLSAVVEALVLVTGSVTAVAAESDAFSYLTGQQRSTERNEAYEQAAELPEDEQAAFLAENGIADTPYSEDAAESYSYVTGQNVGALYEDDTEDETGYSYTTGQEVGASYVSETEDGDAYSYLTGQQNSTNRNDLYTKADELPEEERDAFLAENGIGETTWSEDAAESYSYVSGQQRGASYRQDDDTDSTQDMSEYSYLTGQQRSIERNEAYEQAAELPEDEQDASLAENGIADTTYSEDAAESYSYVNGQQNSTNRNDLYAKADELPEEERDAFLAENGIGETTWSEDAAASYSYVSGQQRGASYQQDDDTDNTQDMSGYSYLTGQQRGNSYHK